MARTMRRQTSTSAVASIQNAGAKKRAFPLNYLMREKIKFFIEQTKKDMERFGLPGAPKWLSFLTKFINSPNVDEQLITSWLERDQSLKNKVLMENPADIHNDTPKRYNIRPRRKAASTKDFEIPKNWFDILQRLDEMEKTDSDTKRDSRPSLETLATKNFQEGCQPSTSAGLRLLWSKIGTQTNQFENQLMKLTSSESYLPEENEDEYDEGDLGVTDASVWKTAAIEDPIRNGQTEVCPEASSPSDLRIVKIVNQSKSQPQPQSDEDTDMDVDIDVGMEVASAPLSKSMALNPPKGLQQLNISGFPTHPIQLLSLRSTVGENHIHLQLITILENGLAALKTIMDAIQDIINSIENVAISHDVGHNL